MSKTRGPNGKARRFSWRIADSSIIITNDRDRVLVYTADEVYLTLTSLKKRFGTRWFPLANNVERLGNGEEMYGLGTTLYGIKSNTTYAQGSSYLGVVFEELGVFEWNGKNRGIAWKLKENPSAEAIREKILGSARSPRAS